MDGQGPASGIELQPLMDPRGDEATVPIAGTLNHNDARVARACELYALYTRQGLACALVRDVTHLITVAFTTMLTTFMVGFMDWRRLFACHWRDTLDVPDHPCGSFSHYVYPSLGGPFVALRWLVASYLSVMALYWAWLAVAFVSRGPSLMRAHRLLHAFGFTSNSMVSATWDEVLRAYSRHVDMSEADAARLPFVVAAATTRFDNYMTAITSCGVLQWPASAPYTQLMDWCMGMLLHDIMEHPAADNVEVLRDRIKRRCVRVGLVALAVAPFTAVFMTTLFVLRHAHAYRDQSGLLTRREWSPWARRVMRDYNEMPHVLDRRMAASSPHTARLMRQFPWPVVNTLARFVGFVAGALVVFLSLLAFFDETALLGVRFGGRNLLWYLGVFSALFYVARAMAGGSSATSGSDPDAAPIDPATALRRMVPYTHWAPKAWRKRPGDYATCRAVGGLFQHRVTLLLQELAGALTTPYLLLTHLPRQANRMAHFTANFTTHDYAAGACCSFATFDLDAHGNAHYGARVHAPRAKRSPCGKVERSVLSFYLQHPAWVQAMPASCRFFITTLQAFQASRGQVGCGPGSRAPLTHALRSPSSPLVLGPGGEPGVSGGVEERKATPKPGWASAPAPFSAPVDGRREATPDHGPAWGETSTTLSDDTPLSKASIDAPLSLAAADERLDHRAPAFFYWLDRLYETRKAASVRERIDGEGVQVCAAQ